MNLDVTINGISYRPVVAAAPRIGIAITTHNRPDLLRKALEKHAAHLPPQATLRVIDDGSQPPAAAVEGVGLIRHATARGIARAKNACLSALLDAGCEHLFLFDDDIWPRVDDWWRPYVANPQPHLMHIWGEAMFYRDDHIAGFTRPKGAMLYVERRVVDRVGGMDPRFGLWGFEHESWSDRIHNAGFTTCRYQDALDTDKLFQALDRTGDVASSVPERTRQGANPQLAEQKRDSDEFVPYREAEPAAQSTVALSVLVPSLHTRWDTFARNIQQQLFDQYRALPEADRDRVEILMLTDTRSMVLGEKRNAMARLACGDYVAFVDDDDRLEPDYLSALLAATAAGADVITFDVSVTLDGGASRLCRYSLAFTSDKNTATEYQRQPNHICAVKRRLVLRTPFPAAQFGEDRDYAQDLRPLLRSEHAIGRVLYHYDYSRDTTETQLMQRYQQRIAQRARPPIVDVVMLSRAADPAHRAMTQRAIDSCHAGAGGKPVNVLVMEQIEGVRYRNATTVTRTDHFRYNAFANAAIATGSAPWVLTANNDLEFEAGWLAALLAANHDVMSPIDPDNARQRGLTRNTQGDTNGVHFSGWAFMVRRTVWERMGGFDPDFEYYCADDSVIEQAKALGIKPMVVPAARVRHLLSKTGGDTMPDDMTWGMVHRFNQKYGKAKFETDPRYLRYLKQRSAA